MATSDKRAGTIRKRGDSWQALLSWRDDAGRTVQVSATRKTEKEAGLALAELMVKRDTQRLTIGHDTLAAVADKYMATIAPDLAPSTVAIMDQVLRLYLLPEFGTAPMKKITPVMVDTFYRQLVKRGLSPNYIRVIHQRLTTLCNQAVKWGVLYDSPTRRATPPKTTATPFAVLEPQDLRRLLDAASTIHRQAHAYLTLVAVTGSRRIEICHLRRGDVDLDAGTIDITRSKTDNGIRTVSVDGETVAVLAEQMAWQERALRLAGADARPEHYLFSFGLGKDQALKFDEPLPVRTADKWFTIACRKAGISGVRLHDLRHTHITHLLDAGVPVKVVSDRVGHGAASMTYKYGHRAKGGDRDAADLAGRMLFGGGGDAEIIPIRKEA